MTATVLSLIDVIKAKSQSIALGEGNLVELVIDVAKDFAALQQQCKRKWLKELRKLDYHQRVSYRYAQIGKSWWCDPSGPLGSTLAQQLPYDLQKLEWLSRLPKADLEELLKDLDPKRRAVLA